MKKFAHTILSFMLLAIALVVKAGYPTSSTAAPQSTYPFYPAVLRCQGLGTGDLEASTHGIRFKVDQPFVQIALRMAETGGSRATYTFDAELRRGSNYSGPADYTAAAVAYLPPDAAGVYHYERVVIDFGSEIPVTGSETFTLKFANISGEGSLYFETRPSSPLCPSASATDLAATPAIVADPAGLTVMRGSWSRGLTAREAPAPPLIDGRVDPGEWPGQRFDFGAGFVSLTNDDFRLYVLIDLLDDPEDSSTERVGLTFDVNENYLITPGVDRQYLVMGNGELQYRICENDANCSTGALEPTIYSSRARSYDCFEADGSLVFETNGDLQTPHCARHVVWELAIDLEEIKGGSKWRTRVGLFGNSDAPTIAYEAPVEPRQYWDFTQLLEVFPGPGLYR